MASITGKFTLFNVKWTIEESRKKSPNIYYISYDRNVITLYTDFEGNRISTDILVSRFWEAAFKVILVQMQKAKLLNNSEFVSAYASLLEQAIVTLNVDNQYSGGFSLGIKQYSIRKNPQLAKEDVIGRFYCPTSQIEVTGNHTHEENIDTIFHEIVHAINHRLGLQDHKIDREDNVNVLSKLIAEIYRTITNKIFINESAIKKTRVK